MSVYIGSVLISIGACLLSVRDLGTATRIGTFLLCLGLCVYGGGIA